jgi:uncharacterized protein (TIGR03437 family)
MRDMTLVIPRLPCPAFRGATVILIMLTAACAGLRAQSVVTLQQNAAAAGAEVGLTTVSVTGINFPATAIAPANVIVSLAPSPPATGPSAQVPAATVANLAGTSKRVSFVVPSLSITQPTPYVVTIADAVQGQLFTSGNAANLLINPPATVQSVTPTTGLAGTTLAVTIQGLYSNFFNGTSSVNAGAGIVVQSVAVISPTIITAQFAIASNATPGPRAVTVTTATEVASVANAFTVAPGFAITDFNPKSASIGTLITITGTDLQPNTGTAAQVTLAKQGGGTISAPVSNPTATSLAFVIPAGAATGPLSVAVNGNSASTTTPLTIVPAFSLSAAPPAANVIQGQSTSYSLSLNTSAGFNQPATLNVTGLPAGFTASFNPPQITAGQTSILTVSAPVGKSFGSTILTVWASATVTGIPVTKSISLSLNIQPVAMSFATPSTLPYGEAGAIYSQSIAAKGGVPPYTFDVSAGLLPVGLSLDPAGNLSGTAAIAGVCLFAVTIKDSTGASSSGLFSLTINAGPSIVTTSSLPNGTAGVAYSQQIVVSGGATPYRFWTSGAVPPGFLLDVNGFLSGTPAQSEVGTFSFTVVVIDNLGAQAPAKTFQISIVASTPLLQASPSSLNFSAMTGADSPPSQAVSIVPASTSQGSLTFRVVVDTASNTAPPPWITVSPSSGNAPTQLVVSVNQGTLALGMYSARIQITDGNGSATDVGVTLSVAASTPQLQVIPSSLAFAARAQVPTALVQTLVVSGGGSLAFTASVLGASSWITSVSPNSGQTAPNSPVFLQVIVNPQGLNTGSYRDMIQVSSSAGNIDVGVSLFVAQGGAILGVDVTGLRLQARQGGGYSNPQTVNVLNAGDPSTTIHWSADLVSGASVVSLTPSSGTSTASDPGALTVAAAPAATEASPGGYYALVRISDPNALNSPQYVSVVLDLESNSTPPLPDPSPPGLFFLAVSHGSSSAGQVVTVSTSSSMAVPFQVAASTLEGSSWLNVSPSSGSSSGQAPGTFMVSVNPSGLSPGVYTGSANVSMSGTVRTVNVTTVVLASGSARSAEQAHVSTAQVSACSPGKLVLTETGLVNSFAVPAAWPETLIVQLNDDCGAAVLNGSVVASFSNGDPPLSLRGDGQTGAYSATWQPAHASSQTTIAFNATGGTLQPATAQLIGGISPNAAPSLAPGSTVNAFYRTSGALAPGTVAEVYGSGLASQTAAAGSVPLPTTLNGTFALIGGVESPLFYTSDGQLDVQIPSELPSTQQYVIVVSANNAYTVPQMIDVVPAQPGVASLAGGQLLAQHSDFTLVDSGHPAKPGEFLVIYLTGMGPTNPNVPSGAAAPSSEPLARVTLQPTVTVDGQSAIVAYAGLTPGAVGLYQINFQVPQNTNSGDLNVVVTQGGVISNTTQLSVSQ